MTTETTATNAADTESSAAATTDAATAATTSTTAAATTDAATVAAASESVDAQTQAAAVAAAVAAAPATTVTAPVVYTTLRQWATEQSARDKRVALLNGFVYSETQARHFKDTPANFAARYVEFANKPLS